MLKLPFMFTNLLSQAPLLGDGLVSEAGIQNIVEALVYSLIGVILFGVVWLLIVKVSPFSIRKEIEEDQNTALGIILGAVIIGIALIISAAISG